MFEINCGRTSITSKINIDRTNSIVTVSARTRARVLSERFSDLDHFPNIPFSSRTISGLRIYAQNIPIIIGVVTFVITESFSVTESKLKITIIASALMTIVITAYLEMVKYFWLRSIFILIPPWEYTLNTVA